MFEKYFRKRNQISHIKIFFYSKQKNWHSRSHQHQTTKWNKNLKLVMAAKPNTSNKKVEKMEKIKVI